MTYLYWPIASIGWQQGEAEEPFAGGEFARGESEPHLRRARAALWEWETQLETRRKAARP